MANLSTFDPNAAGNPQNNIFGLPFQESEARLIVQPIPWEATVNLNPGTARCMEHIMRASIHIDLFYPEGDAIWKQGIFMRETNKQILLKSDYLRNEAELLVDYTCRGDAVCDNPFMAKNLKEINEGCQYLNKWVYEHCTDLLSQNKLVGLLGGEHSIAFGYVKALAEEKGHFGILQIDAHADLRKTFEGFVYSHATVMRNILEEVPQVIKLVQVGTRDFSQEEYSYMRTNKGRIATFFDQDIKEQQYEGVLWKDIAQTIIEQLPDLVYVSLDVDGLDPKLCPGTASPTVGGFDYGQIKYLLKKLRRSGRTIIGFDFSQIGNNGTNIDARNAAHILWDLCNQILISNTVKPKPDVETI